MRRFPLPLSSALGVENMEQHHNLIQEYVSSGLDKKIVGNWYSRNLPNDKEIISVAELIGKMFVSQKINYEIASGLFNQLMPLIGFEIAPARFWEYYIAFENTEALQNPEESARKAVLEVANHGAA